MRADPIYLRADLGKLLLFDATTFAIEREEAEGLIRAINAELAHRGLQLSLGKDPARWYLRLPRAPKIKTWPPSAALGQHVDPYLPSGEDSRWWHALANEVQMALHAADINTQREQRGQVPINSVWFWGAGELPEISASRWAKVFALDPAIQALAEITQSPLANPPQDADALQSALKDTAGDILAVLPDERETLTSSREDQLSALERDWFAPLISMLRDGTEAEHEQLVAGMLRDGTLSEIQLLSGAHQFSLSPKGSWRVWRPRLSQLPV